MPPTIVQSFSDTTVKIRFGETYVSDGLNAKMAGVIPRGFYRGFSLVPSVAPLTVQLDPDASLLHLAVYETLTGRSLTLRVSGGSIPISLAAFAGTTVYVALFAEYAVGSPTSAELRVYSVADYNGAAEKDELVVLGTVAVPGAGVIPASAISLAEATYPWKSAVISRSWKQIVRNGSFDEGTGITDAAGFQSVPGWRGEEPGGTLVRSDIGNPRTGTNALLMQATGVQVMRMGPGKFDITKPLSGAVVPVRDGQLVHASAWLAGAAIQPYTAGTSGFRFILRFYNESDVLQSTEQIASDPAVHVGTFGYTQLQAIFTAPTKGYFTWYLEASADLAAGVSNFWVDDVRIFLEPTEAIEDEGEADQVGQPTLRGVIVDVVPDNSTTRAAQNNAVARLSAEESGSETVLSLTKAGQSGTSVIPRWATPHIFKKVDQDFSQGAFGVGGTDSTADQDTVPHAYKLLHAYRASQADQVRVRVYSRTTNGEYVITSNARWGGGGAQHWLPDNTALDAMKFSFGVAGPRWESKDGVLPATWLDSAWDGTVGAGTGLIQLLFAATLAVDQNDATSPLITTSKIASDHPGFPANFIKVLAAFPTGMSGIYARVYSSTGAASAIPNFFVVLNAEWNPTTGLWTADDIGHPALRYSIVVNPLASYFSVDSKAVTTVPWGENPGGIWDVSPVDDFGHYKTIGQYDWILSRTFTYLLPIQHATPYADAAGAVFWRLTISGGATFWTALATGLAFLEYPLELPQDVTLTRVRVIVGNAAASGVGIDVGYDSGYDFAAPPGVVAHTSLDAPAAPNAAGIHTITASMSHVIDKTNRHYMIRVSADTIGDDVFAFEVRYTSPGLRGY